MQDHAPHEPRSRLTFGHLIGLIVALAALLFGIYQAFAADAAIQAVPDGYVPFCHPVECQRMQKAPAVDLWGDVA